MTKQFLILTILSLAIVFNAEAKSDIKMDSTAEALKIKFKEIDKDGKTYITEKVYIKYHDKKWKLLDKNKVEFVDKNDFVASCKQTGICHPKFEEKAFEEIDFNKDGKITKKEYKLHKELEFTSMDKNGNGKVNEAQYIDAMKGMMIKYKVKTKTPDMKRQEKYKYEVK